MAAFRGGEKGGDHGFVEGEEMFDTLAVGGEAGGAVEPVDGAVEGGVRSLAGERH
jgi:hypothetical protein